MAELQQIFGQFSFSSTSTALTAIEGNSFSFIPALSSQWIVDSGASDHMSGNLKLFQSFSTLSSPCYIKIEDGSLFKVIGKGSVQITPKLVLLTVLYVPNLSCNMLSVSAFVRDVNCHVHFGVDGCVFQEQDSRVVTSNARLHNSLYTLDTQPSSSSNCSSAPHKSALSSSFNLDPVMLWHFRLGHADFNYIKRMFPNLFLNNNSSSFTCAICQLAKHTRTTYLPASLKLTSPFSTIHSDIWGPCKVPSTSGSRWFVSFIDDFSRTTWTFEREI
ncbi:hypothetical protein HRI_000649300 [Hibiscus trionum]|uniref:GAG-pre-integrase domain-containing protein n=1 Tax=Hibiscus trionum TaxID=183268 RepID=A0A9W7LNL7_HIBTR|nr:hypothetical protein HRI_000649300 [Hibiscus trionum]